jgi:hypothetical protein
MQGISQLHRMIDSLVIFALISNPVYILIINCKVNLIVKLIIICFDLRLLLLSPLLRDLLGIDIFFPFLSNLW